MTAKNEQIKVQISKLKAQKEENEQQINNLWDKGNDYYPGYNQRNNALQEEKKHIEKQIEELSLQLSDSSESALLGKKDIPKKKIDVPAVKRKLMDFLKDIKDEGEKE